jgi:hypothetical protein
LIGHLKLTHQKVECLFETFEAMCGSHTTDAL